MNVIIPAAGISHRMKIVGNKSLLKVGHETIIERQIRVIKEVYPEAKITVVVGYEWERFTKLLPAYVNFVINHHFATTNVVHSLSVAMEYLDAKRKTLFVFGDMVFDQETVRLLRGTNHSTILFDQHEYKRIAKNEAGIITQESQAMQFNYTLKDKFVPIFLLGAKEVSLFRSLCREKHNANKCVHEILNKMIDLSHVFKTVAIPQKNIVFEIDTRKDLKQFNRLDMSV